ncbi:hypothetical protein [Lactiplantibacillus plantarum]|nr:hypothetical protein [Lactiplantibacillus plantarum]
MKLISEKTDKVWNGDAEINLVAFLKAQLDNAGTPLSPAQVSSLTVATTALTKATTKNTLVAMINVLSKMGVLNAD